MELSIAIPMYNEEENVKKIEEELIPELNKLNLEYEVIVIDDGSKDNTSKNVEELQKKYKMIKLVKHRTNKGLGKAIETGFENTFGNYLIMLDGDFTYKATDIIKLWMKRNEADCVIGSPYLIKQGVKSSIHRKILSWGINFLYSIFLGVKLSCYTGIFRCYKKEDIEDIKIESPGFISLTEILIKLVRKKKTFIEVPTKLHEREFGISKINTKKEIINHLTILGKLLLGKI